MKKEEQQGARICMNNCSRISTKLTVKDGGRLYDIPVWAEKRPFHWPMEEGLHREAAMGGGVRRRKERDEGGVDHALGRQGRERTAGKGTRHVVRGDESDWWGHGESKRASVWQG